MSDITVTATRMKEGVWEAILRRDREETHADLPSIEVTLDNATVPDVQVIPDQEGSYVLRVPVPREAICDGVQTFLVHDGGNGQKLGAFTLIAGEGVEDDIRAEIGLLRAELDMLKRAFRRHCLETM
ncbi:hypothetical protein [Marimonas arenosa]|uniref:Uncharacterized protein n=1 Tax=Marimonas arenosa TaxID=1795305 RepID=A0AAE3WFW2_9RHOB|nr:hypothetical protein [Marimonas arenosa]MDQ2090925.1 hypothetical protein [Marimonas arenosa]